MGERQGKTIPDGIWALSQPEQKIYLHAKPGGVVMDPWEIMAIRMAADIATRLHTGQYHENESRPFILHPARVAGLVALFGGRYQELVAAWLHDVLEKNPQGETQLAYGLSSLKLPGDDAIAVYRMIKALTRDPRVTEEEQLKDSLERIIDAPPGATLIKLCERLDNLTSLEKKETSKEYRDETMMVLAMLFGRSVESGYTQCHETLKRCMVEDAMKERKS
jgi:(p)ppGpp synthase/HD superfamily hydrolase